MNPVHQIIPAISIINKSSFVTREAADIIIDKISQDSFYYVQIDFKGVSFISRSFADQFHKHKIELWKNNSKKIEVINAENDVFYMFQAVSKTQSQSSRIMTDYPIVHFTTRRSLKDYLYSL